MYVIIFSLNRYILSTYSILKDMNPSFKKLSTKDYIIRTDIQGHTIMPSDSFEIGNNEYILLEILMSTDDILFLKIMGIRGAHTGNQYLIPKHEFEESSPAELSESLFNYQH